MFNVYISEVRNIYDMNLLYQYKLEIQIQGSNEHINIVEKEHIQLLESMISASTLNTVQWLSCILLIKIGDNFI